MPPVPIGVGRPSLHTVYTALLAHFGPQHWWPGDTPAEVAIGAVLTQNTAWVGVEKAITALKRAGALDFGVLDAMPEHRLAELIRPAGTYRVKARRLGALARWVVERAGGDLTVALTGGLAELRGQLLAIHGIGPETADAILLYAGGYPTFVVDAYTRRILRRHGYIRSGATYDEIQRLLERAVPPDVSVYNEYHALLVVLAKRHCRVRADCHGCPLAGFEHDESL